MNFIASAGLDRWFAWMVAASWQLAVLVAIVAAVAWLLRGASARLRYALWLLVLLKVFLPPSVTAPWGVGTWLIAPLGERALDAGITVQSLLTAPLAGSSRDAHAAADESLHRLAPGNEIAAEAVDETQLAPLSIAAAAWLVGCLAIAGFALWKYGRLSFATLSMRPVDEGPARVELERLAMELGVRRVPELYEAESAGSPFLFGVLRPTIVAPRQLLNSAEDLRTILLHELIHWRRGDTWVGWLQVAASALFWFHPLVWLASARLRHEREAACDEAVLRWRGADPSRYGETLLRVLTAARGRSTVQGSLVGVFERGTSLQQRLEAVMNFQPHKSHFGWAGKAAIAVLALLLLPMAPPHGAADDERVAAAAREGTGPATPDAEPSAAATVDPQSPPRFTSEPPAGATDVDPNLSEIVLTFDRDMSEGMSWTGDPKMMPPVDRSRQPQWRDKRTCVLPVKLKPKSFYVFGVNSTSYQNFQSADGQPVLPAVVAFTTEGASESLKRRLAPPEVVEIEPENGADGVDPFAKTIRVTFNMPMGEGFSWVGQAPTAEGQAARWSRDHRTCILPVELKPHTTYELSLNSAHHTNFRSRWGVPLQPAPLMFTTGEGAEAQAEDRSKSPRIVKMQPENGDAEVDPNLKAIRVTFDRPMGRGFSWTGGGPHFPEIPEGKQPSWSRDGRTATLPVQLKPNWEYRLGLNSPSFKNFTSRDGAPLEPVAYRFKTRSE